MRNFIRATPLILCLAFWLAPMPTEASLFWSRSFKSPALGGSMKYSIYLPSGYEDPKQQKPVIPWSTFCMALVTMSGHGRGSARSSAPPIE